MRLESAAYPWMARPDALAKAAQDDELRRIEGLVSSMAPRLRRAFMEAVTRLSETIDLHQLESLLRQGRVSEAIEFLNARAIANGMSSFGIAVTEATAGAAGATAIALRSMPALQGAHVVFGVTNPQTINHLRAYEMNLIRDLSAQALASVRAAIQDGVAAGRNPRDVARDVKAFIGLTERQTRAVMNYRRMLATGDREAMQRALRDKRFDAAALRAFRDGVALPQEKIDRMVARYRERYLKYRAETIARTEAIRAVTRGNMMAWERAIADGHIAADLVTRKWIYTQDGRTRHAHRTIPQMNADGVGMYEPFQSELGPIMYPGDPDAAPANVINCRCALIIRAKPKVAS